MNTEIDFSEKEIEEILNVLYARAARYDIRNPTQEMLFRRAGDKIDYYLNMLRTKRSKGAKKPPPQRVGHLTLVVSDGEMV